VRPDALHDARVDDTATAAAAPSSAGAASFPSLTVLAQHRNLAAKLVVMGVAGCGKSTLAAGIADALAAEMIEGDAHHLPSSRDKMTRGIALQDSDREPWLDRLGAMLAASPGAAILACSALKLRYRERLRAAVPRLRFVFIEIEQAEAARRVGLRSGHLFPAALVASQFEALEAPHGEAGVLTVAATLPPEAQLDAALRWLGADAARDAAAR
jgi:gluconokinase